MSTKTTRIDELTKLIKDAKNELAFLNDSDIFYPLDLGTGTKSVMVIDFNEVTGNKLVSSDNVRKIATNWYKNYSAYIPQDEQKFYKAFRRLRSIQKLSLIHDYLETSDFHADLTGKNQLASWWTIGINNDGDKTASPQTYYVPVEVPTTVYGTDNKPSTQSSFFYFSSEVNAQNAISYMIDLEKDSLNIYDDLDYLFGNVKSLNSSIN